MQRIAVFFRLSAFRLLVFCLLFFPVNILKAQSQTVSGANLISFAIFSLILAGFSIGIIWYLSQRKAQIRGQESNDLLKVYQQAFIRQLSLGVLILFMPVIGYTIYLQRLDLVSCLILLQTFNLIVLKGVKRLPLPFVEKGIVVSGYAVLLILLYCLSGVYLMALGIITVFIVNTYLINSIRWQVINLLLALVSLAWYFYLTDLNLTSGVMVSQPGLEAIVGAVTMFMIAYTLFFYHKHIREFQQGITQQYQHLQSSQHALNTSYSLLQATLESTGDGILVVDMTGNYTRYNQQFIDIWGLDSATIKDQKSEEVITAVLGKLENPDIFLNKVRELYADKKAISYDTLRFKDGRILERYSQPHQLDGEVVGRVWSFRDVTTRILAEEKLQASEKRFRSLFENSLDGLLVYNRSLQTFVDCNQEACAIFDLEIEALLLHAQLLVPMLRPDDVSGTPLEILDEIAATGKSLRFEADLLKKDRQSLFTAEATFIPNLEDSNEILLMIKDISPEKEAEQALKDSESRYRQLIEYSPSGISISDLAGNLIYISPQSYAIFGSSPEEVFGRSLMESLHPDEKKRAAEYMTRLMKEESPVEDRFLAIRNDGSPFYIDCKAALVYDSAGTPDRIMMIFNDVTEQINAEKRLKASELQYKNLVEASPSGIVQFNSQGIQLYVSPRNEELFGYEPGETIGRNILEFVDPESHPAVLTGIADLYSGKRIVVKENVKAYTKEGRTIYIEGIARLIYQETGEPGDVLLICNDVTEKIETEQILKKTRIAYQMLYENMFDGVLIYNYEQEKLIGCNDAARQLFGFDPEEDLSTYSRFSIIPQYSEYTGEIDLHTYTNTHKEKVLNLEKLNSFGVFQRKDGSLFLADVNVIPTHQKKGEGFVLIHDTTKRVLRKKALALSEQKYRNIFDNSHQAIFVFDLESMRPIDCNIPTLNIFGCETKEQFLKESPKTFTGETQLDGLTKEAFIQDKIKQVMEEGKAQYRSVAKKLNGEEFINEVTLVADFSEGKNHILFFVSDITEQYNAQREIAEREMIYQALIDNTFNGIDIHEISGPNLESKELEGKVIVRNETMKRMLKVDSEPMINMETLLARAPQMHRTGISMETYIKETIDVLNEQGYVRYNWQVKGEAGDLIDIEGTTHQINIHGKLLLIRIAEEVTEKNRQQEIINRQLDTLNRKNEELKRYIESNMQLENFAYMASHDLKAPIRTIVSFSQLLERTAGKKMDDQEKEYMEFIVSASLNMHRLINDLLAYSRVNTEQHRPEKLHLPHLIREIKQELNLHFTEKQASIQVKNLPGEIMADSTKMRQLFQNLILNAMKFQRPGVAPTIEIDCEDMDTYWKFSVKDNGIGIKEEFFKKIFLLFRKLHSADQYEGTGIGLAICQKIAQQHGGNIWVESEQGAGSTFYVSIEKKAQEHLSEDIRLIS